MASENPSLGVVLLRSCLRWTSLVDDTLNLASKELQRKETGFDCSVSSPIVSLRGSIGSSAVNVSPHVKLGRYGRKHDGRENCKQIESIHKVFRYRLKRLTFA